MTNIQAGDQRIQNPGPPVLYNPAQGATNVSTTIKLIFESTVPGAVSYHFQVSMDSLFSQTVVNDSITPPGNPTIGPLSYSTTYYWRVNDHNTGTSAWSTVWHFTTVAGTPINSASAPPKLLQITNGTFQFSLSQKSPVMIRIIDSKGSTVKTLVNETRGKGAYTVAIPNEFRTGFYLLDFTAGKYHKVMPIRGD